MSLHQALFFITNGCNLRCSHCYVSASGRLRNELSFHEQLEVINMLKNYGFSNLTLLGGEPLILPRFSELLDYSIDTFRPRKDGSSNVIVQTAGTFPNFPWRRHPGVNVQVSLESCYPHEDELVRGNPNLIEKFLNSEGLEREKALRELVANGEHYESARKTLEQLDMKSHSPAIRMTCFSFNSVLKTTEWAFQNNYNVIMGRYKVFGRGKVTGFLHPPSADKMANIYYETKKLLEKYPGRGAMILDPQWQLYNQQEYAVGKKYFKHDCSICPAGTHRLSIDATGSAFFCHFPLGRKEFYLGNILTTDFYEIKAKAEEIRKKMLETPLIKSCQDCQWLSICQGGCYIPIFEGEKRGDADCPLHVLGWTKKQS